MLTATAVTARLVPPPRPAHTVSLDDLVPPGYTGLSRIRQRLGIDLVQRFFDKGVDLCQQVGLVWDRDLYFDAIKVEADPGIPSLIPTFLPGGHGARG